MSNTCQATHCKQPRYAKALCSMHYRRQRRGGVIVTDESAYDTFTRTDEVRSPEDLPVHVRDTTEYQGRWGVIIAYPRFDGSEHCNGHDVNEFYPEEGRDVAPETVALCDGCPFLTECREWGMAAEKHGFFGGMTANQRRKARARRGQIVVDPFNASVVGLKGRDWNRHMERIATKPHLTQDEEHPEFSEATRARMSELANRRWRNGKG